MEIYDISIAPGQIRDIFCNGSYVYFYAGSAGGADATITVNQDSRGQRVLLQPGQAYRMSGGDTGTRWLIGNLRGEGTIVGRLVIGSGELTDNRVTGSVEVVDGGKNRSMAGAAWIAQHGVATPVAGKYASGAIFNPAGSGTNLILKSIYTQGPVAVACNASWKPGGLSAPITDGGMKPQSKSASVAASAPNSHAAVLQYDSTTLSNPVSANVMFQLYFTANARDQITFSEPLVIAPGTALQMTANSPAVAFGLGYDWFEEPV